MPFRLSRFSAVAVAKIPVWQWPAWPAFTWDEQLVQAALQHADQAQLLLTQALQGIGFDGAQSINRDLWSQDALATAAIEGQNLDVQAVRSSVGHRLGLVMPKGADRDVEGLVQMMQEAMQQHRQPLTEKQLCAWQEMIFPCNDDMPGKLRIVVGSYRTHTDAMQIISGALGTEVVHYIAPPSVQVPHEMQRLLYWLEATRPEKLHSDKSSPADGARQLGVVISRVISRPPGIVISRPPGVVRAALAHLWFEAIHPFEDGNGRVGRALADYVLAQELGTTQRVFSLSRQIQAERKDYYSQLNSATYAPQIDAKGIDVTAWVLWFIGVFTRGCEHSLGVIRLASDKAVFWQRCAPLPLSERQRKVLARLLDAGDGGFLGGLTADKYIKLTGASKATATRDLSQLLQLGLLAVQGQGKGTRYAVAMVGWHLDFDRNPASTAPQEFL